MQKSLSYFTCI